MPLVTLTTPSLQDYARRVVEIQDVQGQRFFELGLVNKPASMMRKGDWTVLQTYGGKKKLFFVVNRVRQGVATSMICRQLPKGVPMPRLKRSRRSRAIRVDVEADVLGCLLHCR